LPKNLKFTERDELSLDDSLSNVHFERATRLPDASP